MSRQIAGALLVAVLLAPPLRAQQDRSFRSEEQVTAIDLAISLDPPRGLRRLAGPPSASGFRVVLGGEELPVVALDPPPTKRGEAPWTFLLYFDLALSDRSQASWAADLLSHHLAELTRLGTVELVVADPEPRTVVAPTREAGAIDQVLSRMVFFPEAEDALVEARLRTATDPADAEATGNDEEAPGPAGAATGDAADTGATALERALVTDRLDRMLLAAVDRSAGAEPRRAIFLATGGFNPPATDRTPERTAATLAAYGWTVIPLLEHPPSGTVPGLRIGKWRFHKAQEPWLFMTTFLGATREQERDPEQARAYLELAKARRAQGELEGAGRAARQAMTHFADDPRTATEQAQALIVLAKVYEAQGRNQLARRTYLRAATRDPEALADRPELAAAVRRPEAALGRLASATLGRVVRSEKDWEPALRTLDHRALATIQLSGPPDGRLHPVQVRLAGSAEPVPAVASARFGTPLEVVAARARSLLDDVPEEGTLPISAAILPAPAASGPAEGAAGTEETGRPTDRSRREPILALRADPSALAAVPRSARLRATLAVPGEEGETRVITFAPEVLDSPPSSPWAWALRRPIRDDRPVEWGLVVVDELVSGAWGAALAQATPTQTAQPDAP